MRPRKSAGQVELEMFDRSNVLPLCPDCGYRTLALDRTRSACRHCGQIVVSPDRVRRMLAVAFGGTPIVELD